MFVCGMQPAIQTAVYWGLIMKIKDWGYASEKDFDSDLESLEENATTQWEMEFADTIRRAREKYGLEAFMSKNQYETMQRIIIGG